MNQLERISAEVLDQVAAIEQVDGDVRWSRAQLEQELTLPISRFFVLRDGGNILGYGGYWKVEDEAQITNLAVPSSCRRRGLGQRLLDHLIDQARAEGCCRMTLEVRSQNQAAQALYYKNGFSAQGRRPQAYTAPYDDALLMEKRL